MGLKTVLGSFWQDVMMYFNRVDQAELFNDIEIAGIPEQKKESCMRLLLCVARKLELSLTEREVIFAERDGPWWLPKDKGGPVARPRPLVARFRSPEKRGEFLMAARDHRGITTEDMGLSSSPSNIYIIERLTKYNREIFYKARIEAWRVKWKYVWVRNGKIYARRLHGGRRYRIRCEADIAELFGEESEDEPVVLAITETATEPVAIAMTDPVTENCGLKIELVAESVAALEIDPETTLVADPAIGLMHGSVVGVMPAHNTTAIIVPVVETETENMQD